MNKNNRENTAMPEAPNSPSVYRGGARRAGALQTECVEGRAGWVSYFTIPELTHSLRAQACGIDNTPPASAVPLMVELITKVLDPIREKWQSPIYITSGYRCPLLNKKVGGVENSYHTRGMAADITAKSVFYNTALYTEIRILHAKGLIPLTECYMERQGLYIHVAYDPAAPSDNPFFTK